MSAPFRHPRSAAFTLTEIVLALAVISTAIVALIGVLPVGIDASRKAAEHTVVSSILEDLHDRLRGESLQPGDATFSPAFYNESGAYLSSEAQHTDWVAPFYRAEVRIAEFDKAPEHTSSLQAVKVDLFWPVDPQTGEPLGKGKPKSTVSFAVAPLTGPDWTRIDPRYVPKIEN